MDLRTIIKTTPAFQAPRAQWRSNDSPISTRSNEDLMSEKTNSHGGTVFTSSDNSYNLYDNLTGFLALDAKWYWDDQGALKSVLGYDNLSFTNEIIRENEDGTSEQFYLMMGYASNDTATAGIELYTKGEAGGLKLHSREIYGEDTFAYRQIKMAVDAKIGSSQPLSTITKPDSPTTSEILDGGANNSSLDKLEDMSTIIPAFLNLDPKLQDVLFTASNMYRDGLDSEVLGYFGFTPNPFSLRFIHEKPVISLDGDKKTLQYSSLPINTYIDDLTKNTLRVQSGLLKSESNTSGEELEVILNYAKHHGFQSLEEGSLSKEKPVDHNKYFRIWQDDAGNTRFALYELGEVGSSNPMLDRSSTYVPRPPHEK